VPRTTRVEIPLEEQVRTRAELRRARYGDLCALHLLLLCAAGRPPSEVASVLFCSRSSGYRIVRAYRVGTLTFEEATAHAPRPLRLRLLTPSLKRSVPALLKPPPCLRLVSPALELRHVSGGAPGASGDRSVSRNHAPLAPGIRLGMETRKGRRQGR
jgi:hypothetical protein